MAKTAILLGATGATGREVLKLLLNDERYDKVKLFNRNKVGIQDSKVEEHVIDLLKLEEHKAQFTGDEVFCCIGTTKAKTPDKETYYKIDYGIPVTAAKLANQNGINSFNVISAIGADKNSSIFYNRTKGEMQDAVLKEGIANTYILQPSLIVAHRNDMRLMEQIGAVAMKLLNPLLLGGAAKYRSIKAATIAKAMLWLANNNYAEAIVTSDIIAKLAAEEQK